MWDEEMEQEPLEPEEPEPGGTHVLAAEAILRPVGSYMRTKVGTVSPRDTVAAAVGLMTAGHFGAVLVVEEGRLAGIFSERDVMTRVVDRRLDPERELVGDHMTPDPETLRPEDELAYALNIMTVGGFRHVPIVDGSRRLQGILSIRDVHRFLAEHFREEILNLPPRPPRHGPSERYGG